MLLTWLRAFGEYGAVVILAYNPNVAADLHLQPVQRAGTADDAGSDGPGPRRRGRRRGNQPNPRAHQRDPFGEPRCAPLAGACPVASRAL